MSKFLTLPLTMISKLSACLVATAMICPSIQVHTQDPKIQIEGENLLPVIQTMPEGLPGLAKQKQGAVFSMNQVVPTRDGSMNKGFFIDGNGLALCSLSYLCCDVPLRFEGSSGELLKTLKVLGVFASHHLALVKFAHKPKVWLEISDSRPSAGEWIALISTLRDPDPLTSPALAWRDVGDTESTTIQKSVEILSFASGRNPTLDRIFAKGAPLMDKTGKVIAIYAGQQVANAQALRFARPLDGISNAIQGALRKPLDQQIPIPRKLHHYDDVRLDPMWLKLQQNTAANASTVLLQNIQKLLVTYPESNVLKTLEWEAMWNSLKPESGVESLLAATLRSKPPENAPVLERAAYFERLGKLYMFRSGHEMEAMGAYQKAFELSPQVYHAAGANLAFMHLQRGEIKEAEETYRKVTTHVPERIDYIEALQKVLMQKGDIKGADELTPWIWTLEDLYRSRTWNNWIPL